MQNILHFSWMPITKQSIFALDKNLKLGEKELTTYCAKLFS